MPFVHEPPINLKYSPLSVSYNNGDRFYEVEPGVLCPSITSVLSVNSKDSIAKWRKRVGTEEADSVSVKARFRGNEVHDLCERFVNNEEQIYAYAKAEFDKREKPLPSFTEAKSQIRYRVKSGDYLGKIANKYGNGILSSMKHS